MQQETKQVLELLIQKADELEDLKFIEHVKEVGLGFRGTRTENDEWEIDFGLPDKKERDAFLFTFRLFIQKNEPYSFQNLGRLKSDPSLSSHFKSELEKVLNVYSNFLNGHSEYTVNLFDGHPTRDDMLRTVLYGGMAHTNSPVSMQRFKNWSRDDIRGNLLLQEFTAILVQVMVFIRYISGLSKKELESNP
jgi:hypothetical protein